MSGLLSDAFLGYALVNMYVKCRCFEESMSMLDRVHLGDKVNFVLNDTSSCDVDC
jgi:hypothetical protein